MAANLADLTYFANRNIGGIGAEEVNSARGRGLLDALNSYGANAQYLPSYGSDGQLTGYSLYFDGSKLPGVNGTGHYGGSSYNSDGTPVGGGAAMTSWSTVQPHMRLINPNAVFDSPTYGKVTDNGNIATDRSWVDTYGPALVAAFGFGIPYLAAAMSNGAIGAAGAASAGTATGSTGALADAPLQPMMPIDESSLYTQMLPFNAADPSLAINGITPAEAAAGGAAVAGGSALADAPLQPLMPQDPASLYEPMLPFNAADPSLTLSPGLLSRLGSAASQFLKSPAAASLLGGGNGGAGGVMTGGGGGLLGGGAGAVADPLALLKAFYGDPNLTGMQYLALQHHGLLNG